MCGLSEAPTQIQPLQGVGRQSHHLVKSHWEERGWSPAAMKPFTLEFWKNSNAISSNQVSWERNSQNRGHVLCYSWNFANNIMAWILGGFASSLDQKWMPVLQLGTNPHSHSPFLSHPPNPKIRLLLSFHHTIAFYKDGRQTEWFASMELHWQCFL